MFVTCPFNHEIPDPKRKEPKNPMAPVAANKASLSEAPKMARIKAELVQPRMDDKVMTVGDTMVDNGMEISLPIKYGAK